MTDTILVLGATGNVGSRTVEALTTRPGVSIRAAVHTPAKAARFEGMDRVTAVEFDFDRPATIEAALAGANKAVLVTPFDDRQVEASARFLTAAKQAGLEQLVKISTTGADQQPGITVGRWHGQIEALARETGIPLTILRPGAFMTNFISYFRPDEQGNIYLPLGDGATAYIDPLDIGETAAAVLTSEGHVGKTYTLTGPQALGVAEAAAAIGQATGRSINYVDVPEQASRAAMQQMGAPAWMIDALLELFAIMKAGWTAAVTTDVLDVTGRAPRSFADFAREHAQAW